MLEGQKVTVAVKAAQKELRALALNDDATADQLAEATTKLHDLETRAEALDASEEVVEPVKSEPTEDAAARELRSLTGKTNVGNIFAAVVNHRAVGRGRRRSCKSISGSPQTRSRCRSWRSGPSRRFRPRPKALRPRLFARFSHAATRRSWA